MKQITLQHLNKKIEIYLHDNAKNYDGVFLVVPGMLDDHTNYNDLGVFLNKNNYICAVLTLEKSTDKQDRKNIFDAFKENVNSILAVVKHLQDRYNTEIIFLGHGFGAYLVERFLEISGDEYKVILTGTGYKHLPHLRHIKLPLLLTQAFRLRPHKGDIIKRIIFGKLEKGFENGNWISTNEAFFEEFKKSKSFKTVNEFNFYYSFISNILVKEKNIKNINNKSSILLLWGEHDPLLNSKNVVENSIEKYTSNGINANYKIFDDMLHNILNESENEKVFRTIINFVKQ